MSAVKAIHALTAPVEDYLKAIFEIEIADAGTGPDHAGVAGTNEIAQALGIAPASVTGMLRRLADQELISYERYRGVRLTDAGRRAALRTIRRHRVIEAYLTKALGYPWDRVHDEAERLEHAASDDLIDRMAAAIGEPTTDPHGAPIPTREGTLDAPPLVALVDVAVGDVVRVRQVGDRDPERLRYLAELGVTPGADVRVVGRAPFGGPITLRIVRQGTGGSESARARSMRADRERAIGPTLAAQIFVEVRRKREA
ncbi:MAG TPA: metal-dependent transcriptional regulator [Gemmatimonadaceae bacterium]|jgi:DtxR family Mn-dependent transcriptional regulator